MILSMCLVSPVGLLEDYQSLCESYEELLEKWQEEEPQILPSPHTTVSTLLHTLEASLQGSGTPPSPGAHLFSLGASHPEETLAGIRDYCGVQNFEAGEGKIHSEVF